MIVVNSFSRILALFECVLTIVTSLQWRTLIYTSRTEVPLCIHYLRQPFLPLSFLICQFLEQNMSNTCVSLLHCSLLLSEFLSEWDNSKELSSRVFNDGLLKEKYIDKIVRFLKMVKLFFWRITIKYIEDHLQSEIIRRRNIIDIDSDTIITLSRTELKHK